MKKLFAKLKMWWHIRVLNRPYWRRIYPELISNNITSIQPMSESASLIFYLRFRYSSNSRGKIRSYIENKEEVDWAKEGF
jgi:hypothetical protein